MSEWDCTLERSEDGQPALRLGMRLVKSLSEEGGSRRRGPRKERPFASVQDLGSVPRSIGVISKRWRRRARLSALSGNRHLAFWEVAGTERALPLVPQGESRRQYRGGQAASRGANRRTAHRCRLRLCWPHSRRHPMALLRDRLARNRLLTASDLGCVAHGRSSVLLESC